MPQMKFAEGEGEQEMAQLAKGAVVSAWPAEPGWKYEVRDDEGKTTLVMPIVMWAIVVQPNERTHYNAGWGASDSSTNQQIEAVFLDAGMETVFTESQWRKGGNSTGYLIAPDEIADEYGEPPAPPKKAAKRSKARA